MAGIRAQSFGRVWIEAAGYNHMVKILVEKRQEPFTPGHGEAGVALAKAAGWTGSSLGGTEVRWLGTFHPPGSYENPGRSKRGIPQRGNAERPGCCLR